MNNLEVSKPCEEANILNQECASTTQGFVTSNPQMLRIMDIARHVAQTDVPILILGESGVGKDVLASYIHRHSDRPNGPFVRVNCAALPDELLESELFGYDQGAFTGAAHGKPGKFELAHNGTVLLDEIGEMSPHLQAKLLHVLQDGEFSRLGARRPTKVNVRVLAATNRKLEEAVLKGEFRNDLYFRLNVITLNIPPLRERRGEDQTGWNQKEAARRLHISYKAFRNRLKRWQLFRECPNRKQEHKSQLNETFSNSSVSCE